MFGNESNKSKLHPWNKIRLNNCHLYPNLLSSHLLLKTSMINIVTCYVINKTGSSSGDCVYYQLGYTLTLNYTNTLAIQHYLSFTQFTVHRCGLLPLRTPRGYLLPRTELELASYSLHNLRANHTENFASIDETCLTSHCIATVAALTTANPLLRGDCRRDVFTSALRSNKRGVARRGYSFNCCVRYPATSSKHSYFYCCVRVSRFLRFNSSRMGQTRHNIIDIG
jgi:hypothetical protein